MTDLEAGRAAFHAGDMVRALDLLLPLARAGDAVAQRWAGLAYLDSMTNNPCRSVSEAIHWLKTAADQSDARAAYELGVVYKHGDDGQRIDRPKAAALFQQALSVSDTAAEAGSAEHQFVLGCMYWCGNGVRKNARRGLRWLRLAAEQGDVEHQSFLGSALWFAPDATRDLDEAVHWTTKVAEQGHVGAQYHLAASYATGDEVAQDFRKAAKWYRRAAKLGNAEAAYNLGWMYLLGEGLPVNAAAGLRHLETAAATGYSEAADLLGEIHSRGLYGQSCDPETGAHWLVQAVRTGDRVPLRTLAASLFDGRITADQLGAVLLLLAADGDGERAGEMLRAIRAADRSDNG